MWFDQFLHLFTCGPAVICPTYWRHQTDYGHVCWITNVTETKTPMTVCCHVCMCHVRDNVTQTKTSMTVCCHVCMCHSVNRQRYRNTDINDCLLSICSCHVRDWQHHGDKDISDRLPSRLIVLPEWSTTSWRQTNFDQCCPREMKQHSNCVTRHHSVVKLAMRISILFTKLRPSILSMSTLMNALPRFCHFGSVMMSLGGVPSPSKLEVTGADRRGYLCSPTRTRLTGPLRMDNTLDDTQSTCRHNWHVHLLKQTWINHHTKLGINLNRSFCPWAKHSCLGLIWKK